MFPAPYISTPNIVARKPKTQITKPKQNTNYEKHKTEIGNASVWALCF